MPDPETPLPARPDEALYRQALKDARWLAEFQDDYLRGAERVKVEIVFANPTVREYHVTIVPPPS